MDWNRSATAMYLSFILPSIVFGQPVLTTITSREAFANPLAMRAFCSTQGERNSPWMMTERFHLNRRKNGIQSIRMIPLSRCERVLHWRESVANQRLGADVRRRESADDSR